MNKEELGRKRNDIRRLIEFANRGRVNSVNFGLNESFEHAFTKFKICYGLMLAGKEYYTESVWEKPFSGRADIVVLDDAKVIEILETESDESIELKSKKYPSNLEIEVIRVGE